ncbi:domon-like type 9 carbohydrate-binding module domain [Diaporthe amygdali]|uniref:domon-like type 9 carbohydrate-binding module domain n=1 Tax=Phomopsis amygdali TaxID=1214568 RepID=UPI0022FE02DD|nr:domon-like type 9 carbohydrate-binding module domain [Diaporthe amygdali]KAJ0107982.1 domon-like type 9 carbohydrate-binding module domain [Diaporthe amygdali]
MLLIFAFLMALVSAVPDTLARHSQYSTRPSLEVPACPTTGSITYNTSVPDKGLFPSTQVDLCYDDSSIQIKFTAFEEKDFYYNQSLTTNGDIYNYEVMEAFIYRGTNDPQTYLEFEVAPNNVTFQAFIYNPSKIRAAGAAFDRFYITDLAADGITASTTLDYADELWVSEAQIPLGLFNVDNGTAQGTEWRMNFFRTVTGPSTFPNQTYGAWSPPDKVNFHMTPFFGDVTFI